MSLRDRIVAAVLDAVEDDGPILVGIGTNEVRITWETTCSE